MNQITEAKTRLFRRGIALIALAVIVASTSGCTSFEKDTWRFLHSAKDVIDQASNDYNAGTLIGGKSQANYDLLTKAQQGKDALVLSFKTYWDAKQEIESQLANGQISKATAGQRLEIAIAGVTAVRNDLQPLIDQLKKLKS